MKKHYFTIILILILGLLLFIYIQKYQKILLEINDLKLQNLKEINDLKSQNLKLIEVNKCKTDPLVELQMKKFGFQKIAPSKVELFRKKGKLVVIGFDNKYYMKL